MGTGDLIPLRNSGRRCSTHCGSIPCEEQGRWDIYQLSIHDWLRSASGNINWYKQGLCHRVLEVYTAAFLIELAGDSTWHIHPQHILLALQNLLVRWPEEARTCCRVYSCSGAPQNFQPSQSPNTWISVVFPNVIYAASEI